MERQTKKKRQRKGRKTERQTDKEKETGKRQEDRETDGRRKIDREFICLLLDRSRGDIGSLSQESDSTATNERARDDRPSAFSSPRPRRVTAIASVPSTVKVTSRWKNQSSHK